MGTVAYVHIVRCRRVTRGLMAVIRGFGHMDDPCIPVAIVQLGDEGLHRRREDAHGAKERKRDAEAGPHALNVDTRRAEVKSPGDRDMRPGKGSRSPAEHCDCIEACVAWWRAKCVQTPASTNRTSP